MFFLMLLYHATRLNIGSLQIYRVPDECYKVDKRKAI